MMYSESSLDVLSLSCPLESQRVSTQFFRAETCFVFVQLFGHPNVMRRSRGRRRDEAYGR